MCVLVFGAIAFMRIPTTKLLITKKKLITILAVQCIHIKDANTNETRRKFVEI